MNLQNILIVLLAIASFIYSIKNKQELTLDSIISNLIIQAKDLFLTNEAEKKFDFVLEETKKKIGFPLNLLISETHIKNMINEIYKDKFKEDFWNSENKQMAIIETIQNVINEDATKLPLKIVEMKSQVKTKGYIEGSIKSNLKNNIEAGISFGKKF